MSRRPSRLLRLAVVSLLVLGVLELAGSAPSSAAPEAGSSDWRMVSVGNSHACGLRTSGRLYCWGSDLGGQLGNGLPNADSSTPVQVSGNRRDWVAVSAGSLHTCARRLDGRLYCWGVDQFGEVGDGPPFNSGIPNPTEVAGNHSDWTTFDAGDEATCGRRSNGRLYCWGWDAGGKLGNGGADDNEPAPREVAGGVTTWTGVSIGFAHTCARRSSGRLFCWGSDGNGQLGTGGASTNTSTPVQVAGGRTDWASVTAGASHTCARRTTRRLLCWGADGNAQLGNGGGAVDRQSPTPVGTGTDWTAVDAASFHTCARRSTGRLFCWGNDGNGQLGDGTPLAEKTTPSQVQGGATDWVNLSAGGTTSCATITSRRLFCWGDDVSGQLGDGGADTDMPYPASVFP